MKDFMKQVASGMNTDDPGAFGYTRYGAATYWTSDDTPQTEVAFGLEDYADVDAAIDAIDIGEGNNRPMNIDNLFAALGSATLNQSFLANWPEVDAEAAAAQPASSGRPIHSIIILTDSNSPNITAHETDGGNETVLQIWGCGSQLVRRATGELECIRPEVDDAGTCRVDGGMWDGVCGLWDAFRARRVAVYVLSVGQFASPVSVARFFDVYEDWHGGTTGDLLLECRLGGATACSIEAHGGVVVPYLTSPVPYADGFHRARCIKERSTVTTTGSTTMTSTMTTSATTTPTTTEFPRDCAGYAPIRTLTTNSGFIAAGAFERDLDDGTNGPVYRTQIIAGAGSTAITVGMGVPTALRDCNGGGANAPEGCGSRRRAVTVSKNATAGSDLAPILEMVEIENGLAPDDQSPRVRVAVMLRDPMSPRGDIVVTVSVTGALLPALPLFSCTTGPDGHCIASSDTIDPRWWAAAGIGSAASIVTVAASATVPGAGTVQAASLPVNIYGRVTPPVFASIPAFSAVMPAKTLYQDNQFDIEVEANFPFQLRTMYFLVTTDSNDIEFDRVDQVLPPSAGWSGPVERNQGNRQLQLAVTRSSYSTAAQTSADLLFTIRGHVVRDVSSAATATIRIQCTQSQTSDTGGNPVPSTEVVVTDRAGTRATASGAVNLDRTVRGFFVSSQYPELVNRAVFDGDNSNTVQAAIDFWRVVRESSSSARVRRDGRGNYACASSATILQSAGCNIRLVGTETAGHAAAAVTVRRDSYADRTQQFKVWYPIADIASGHLATMTADNPSLYQIENWIGCDGNGKFQRTRMHMSAVFGAGPNDGTFLADGVQFDRLESSNENVVRILNHPALDQDIVQGVGFGSSTITAFSRRSRAVATFDLAVSGTTVPKCLLIIPFRGIDLNVQGPIVAGQPTEIELQINNSPLEEIGQRVHFVTSVLFGGTRDTEMDLLPGELSISSNAPDTLGIFENNGQPYAEVVVPGLPNQGELVAVEWTNRRLSWEDQNANCTSDGERVVSSGVDLIVQTAAAVRVRVEFEPVPNGSPVGLSGTQNPPFIVYPETSTQALGEVSEAEVRVWIEFDNGGDYEFSMSPLLNISVSGSSPGAVAAEDMIQLSRASDTERFVLTAGTSWVPGRLSFRVEFEHDNITGTFDMSVTAFEDLIVQTDHWPCTHTPRRDGTSLRLISGGNPSVYQSAHLVGSYVTLIDKPGVQLIRIRNAIHQNNVDWLFSDGTGGYSATALAGSSDWSWDEVAEVPQPNILRPLNGPLTVSFKASFFGNESQQASSIRSDQNPIRFSAVSNVRLYARNAARSNCEQIPSSNGALCGLVGRATADTLFDARLSDGSNCPSMFLGAMADIQRCNWRPAFSAAETFSGYFSSAGDSPAALAVDTTTATQTLLDNQLVQGRLTVQLTSDPQVADSTAVYANVDPEFGDIDLGARCTRALPEIAVGDEFEVPVRINSIDGGNRYNIESFNIRFYFDQTVIGPVGDGSTFDQIGEAIVERDQFVSCTVTHPENELVVDGGLLAARNAGNAAPLFTLRLRALRAGMTSISGLLVMAFDDQDRGLPSRAFVAGNLTQIVVGNRRDRRQDTTTAPVTAPVMCIAITCSTFCQPPYAPTCGWMIKNGRENCEPATILTNSVDGRGTGCPGTTASPVSAAPSVAAPTSTPTVLDYAAQQICWAIRCSRDCFFDLSRNQRCGWSDKRGLQICDLNNSRTEDGRLMVCGAEAANAGECVFGAPLWQGECTTLSPTFAPTTLAPTWMPTAAPTAFPTRSPSVSPTLLPSGNPTILPSWMPTTTPSAQPTTIPTQYPTAIPTTSSPTVGPSYIPSASPTASPALICRPEDIPPPEGWGQYVEPLAMPGMADSLVVDAFLDARADTVALGCPEFVPGLRNIDNSFRCAQSYQCNLVAPWLSVQERGDVDGDCCFTTSDATMLTAHILAGQAITDYFAGCAAGDRSPPRLCSPGAPADSLCRACGLRSCTVVQRARRVELMIRNSPVSYRWGDASNDGRHVTLDDAFFLTKIGGQAMLLFDPPEVVPAHNDSNCQVELSTAAYARHIGGVVPATVEQDDKFVVVFRVSMYDEETNSATSFRPRAHIDDVAHQGIQVRHNDRIHGPETIIIAERREVDGETLYMANFSNDHDRRIRVTADVGFWGEQPMPDRAQREMATWVSEVEFSDPPTDGERARARSTFDLSFPCYPWDDCDATHAQMFVRVVNGSGETNQPTLECWEPCGPPLGFYTRCPTLIREGECSITSTTLTTTGTTSATSTTSATGTSTETSTGTTSETSSRTTSQTSTGTTSETSSRTTSLTSTGTTTQTSTAYNRECSDYAPLYPDFDAGNGQGFLSTAFTFERDILVGAESVGRTYRSRLVTLGRGAAMQVGLGTCAPGNQRGRASGTAEGTPGVPTILNTIILTDELEESSNLQVARVAALVVDDQNVPVSGAQVTLDFDSPDGSAVAVQPPPCTTQSNGICEATFPVPSAWFGATGAVSSFRAVSGSIRSADDSVRLLAPQQSTGRAFDAFHVELPRRTFHAGDQVQVEIFANFDRLLESISFSAEVNNSGLRIESFEALAGSGWQGVLRIVNDGMQVYGVKSRTGVSNGPQRIRDHVFTVTMRVMQDVMSVASFSFTVSQATSAVSWQQVNTRVFSYDRRSAAIAGPGQLHIGSSLKGFFVTSTSTELVNTAMFNGDRVTAPALAFWAVTVLGVTAQPDEQSQYQCSSSDEAVLKVGSDCSVYLDGTESSGGDVSVTIARGADGFPTTHPYRVWFPQQQPDGGVVAVSARVPALRQVLNWVDCNGDMRYQRTRIDVAADFASAPGLGTFRVEGLPVRLETSDSDVMELVASTAAYGTSYAQGIVEGTATITAFGAGDVVLGTMSVNATADSVAWPATLAGCLRVFPFRSIVGLALPNQGPARPLTEEIVEVTIDQQPLSSVGQQVHFVGVITFADGVEMDMLADELEITALPLADDTLVVSRGQGGQMYGEVVSPGLPARGNLVQGTWNEQRCADDDRQILVEPVFLEVAMPDIQDVRVTLIPPQGRTPRGLQSGRTVPFLVYPETSTEMLGEVTEANLRIEIVYTDGSSFDFSDNMGMQIGPLNPSLNDVIQLRQRPLNGAYSITTGTARTDSTVSFEVSFNHVSFTKQFSVAATMFDTVEVVGDHWPCRASGSQTATTLNPIAGPNAAPMYQRAALRSDVLLANGERYLNVHAQFQGAQDNTPATFAYMFDGQETPPAGWSFDDQGQFIVWPSSTRTSQTTVTASFYGSHTLARGGHSLTVGATMLRFVQLSDAVAYSRRGSCPAIASAQDGALCGRSGEATADIVFDGLLSDGSVCSNIHMAPSSSVAQCGWSSDAMSGIEFFPNYFTFSGDTGAIGVGIGSGQLTLLSNHPTQTSVRVALVTDASVATTTQLYTDLDPQTIGDLDLGLRCVRPLPVRTANEEFTIDVRVDIGSAALEGFAVDLDYDAEVIDVVAEGPLYDAAVANLNEFSALVATKRGDTLRIVGTFSRDHRKRSASGRVVILTLRFIALRASSQASFTGSVVDLAGVGGLSIGADVLGAEFVAGQLTQIIRAGNDRKREARSIAVHRRQMSGMPFEEKQAVQAELESQSAARCRIEASSDTQPDAATSRCENFRRLPEDLLPDPGTACENHPTLNEIAPFITARERSSCDEDTGCNLTHPASSAQQRGDVNGDCCFNLKDPFALQIYQIVKSRLQNEQNSGISSEWSFEDCDDLRIARRVEYAATASNVSQRWADADRDDNLHELDDFRLLTSVLGGSAVLLDSEPEVVPVSADSGCQMEFRTVAESPLGTAALASFVILYRVAFHGCTSVNYGTLPEIGRIVDDSMGFQIPPLPSTHFSCSDVNPLLTTVLAAEQQPSEANGTRATFAVRFPVAFDGEELFVTTDVVFWGDASHRDAQWETATFDENGQVCVTSASSDDVVCREVRHRLSRTVRRNELDTPSCWSAEVLCANRTTIRNSTMMSPAECEDLVDRTDEGDIDDDDENDKDLLLFVSNFWLFAIAMCLVLCLLLVLLARRKSKKGSHDTVTVIDLLSGLGDDDVFNHDVDAVFPTGTPEGYMDPQGMLSSEQAHPLRIIVEESSGVLTLRFNPGSSNTIIYSLDGDPDPLDDSGATKWYTEPVDLTSSTPGRQGVIIARELDFNSDTVFEARQEFETVGLPEIVLKPNTDSHDGAIAGHVIIRAQATTNVLYAIHTRNDNRIISDETIDGTDVQTGTIEPDTEDMCFPISGLRGGVTVTVEAKSMPIGPSADQRVVRLPTQTAVPVKVHAVATPVISTGAQEATIAISCADSPSAAIFWRLRCSRFEFDGDSDGEDTQFGEGVPTRTLQNGFVPYDDKRPVIPNCPEPLTCDSGHTLKLSSWGEGEKSFTCDRCRNSYSTMMAPSQERWSRDCSECETQHNVCPGCHPKIAASNSDAASVTIETYAVLASERSTLPLRAGDSPPFYALSSGAQLECCFATAAASAESEEEELLLGFDQVNHESDLVSEASRPLSTVADDMDVAVVRQAFESLNDEIQNWDGLPIASSASSDALIEERDPSDPWSCEHDCGFKGSFETVKAHEVTGDCIAPTDDDTAFSMNGAQPSVGMRTVVDDSDSDSSLSDSDHDADDSDGDT